VYSRKFSDTQIVIASHNPGKVREISALIQPFVETVVSASSLNLDEPEETGASFAENAQLKALQAAASSQLPSLADDSGLQIQALNNAPGIYSARWAGPNKDFNFAMQEIERLMANSKDLSAQFVCALTLAWPDGAHETFEGYIKGKIQFPPKGEKGFGYDPIFLPVGYHRTFGELDPEEKDQISHRAEAFSKLIRNCFK
jgi:XTP/dITP diphosphohydrolase